MQTPSAPTDPTPRRSHRGLLTLFALLAMLGATMFPSFTASANEFVPIPSAGLVTAACVPGQGFHVKLLMENKGLGSARFYVTEIIDGGAPSVEQYDVFDKSIVIDEEIPESATVAFSIDSDSGAGFHTELTFGPVDCLADPSAAITIVCPSGGVTTPEIKFSMFNPSLISATIDLSDPGITPSSVPVVNTTDPWIKLVPIANGAHVQAVAMWGDVQLAALDTIVDCPVPPPVVIDTIPVIDTTIPVPDTTVPDTTIPDTTIPDSTVPDTLPTVTTTQEIPPTPTEGQVPDHSATAPVATGAVPGPTSLPRTGSESATMAMLGFGLFLGGLVLVLGTRRSRLAGQS